ncbi:glycoside hydrolase family 3 C-terminal domain-containing protein [Nocardioides bruguierae]|uniref:Exo-alpha-(1->6)-L-arabinopyranosidase n=1 Tax=Nocardioides bruguierae TaxID=2945102 RepID=A0A9X2D9V0_9ACTN|nr:glycoside hydrolase family 3 C-terminal domain-containing protein [Nocardioides bruguierae]MCM0621467.1 glycoside hydrolase family 3 C-terminal domain-containing protein [Nocardioides bruguierae]
MGPTDSPYTDLEAIAGLTLEEKASLGSGQSFWRTKAVGEIPGVLVTDGPHGLRKQEEKGDHLGMGGSVPATCFPPAAGLGQTWDLDLVHRVGEALGTECQAEGVAVLLGPGVNIKRSPLGGRNFEYYSEDPLVAGAMGAAWINGVQSQGVGTSLKHYALNNQEDDRMRSSSDVDARPLREVYLRAFERAVRDSRPWTVMCSYNRVNGVLVSQNAFLLAEVLVGEWDYEGLVVSDWGAVADRVEAVRAGLDLQMPADGGLSDAEVVDAVKNGVLDEAAVDRAAARVAGLATRATAAARPGTTFDADAHHALAREAAARSIVLLRNEPVGDAPLLPLTGTGSVAVIGEQARTPRYQGGGSSHVNPTRLDVPLEELTAALDGQGVGSVTFAPGYTASMVPDQALVDEAVAAAAAAQTCVLFIGLTDGIESEGYDRKDLQLPADQLALLEAVAAVQPRTVVVLTHGSVVDVAPLFAAVPAVVDGALLGQGGGKAVADVLTGELNPSGRLTETVPLRLADTPAFLSFPGEHSHVRYGEGLFVGYKWYDARDMEVALPFGFGLSYTTFAHTGLSLSADEDAVTATVTVTNTGQRAGREVVQAYVGLPGSAYQRAVRVLGGFASVDLEPGESREVTVIIEHRDLEVWDERVSRFVLEPGTYVVQTGSSSRDLHTFAEVEVAGEIVRLPLDLESTLKEVLADPYAGSRVADALPFAKSMQESGNDDDSLGGDMAEMMGAIPVGRLLGFQPSDDPAATKAALVDLLETANAQH